MNDQHFLYFVNTKLSKQERDELCKNILEKYIYTITLVSSVFHASLRTYVVRSYKDFVEQFVNDERNYREYIHKDFTLEPFIKKGKKEHEKKYLQEGVTDGKIPIFDTNGDLFYARFDIRPFYPKNNDNGEELSIRSRFNLFKKHKRKIISTNIQYITLLNHFINSLQWKKLLSTLLNNRSVLLLMSTIDLKIILTHDYKNYALRIVKYYAEIMTKNNHKKILYKIDKYGIYIYHDEILNIYLSVAVYKLFPNFEKLCLT